MDFCRQSFSPRRALRQIHQEAAFLPAGPLRLQILTGPRRKPRQSRQHRHPGPQHILPRRCRNGRCAAVLAAAYRPHGPRRFSGNTPWGLWTSRVSKRSSGVQSTLKRGTWPQTAKPHTRLQPWCREARRVPTPHAPQPREQVAGGLGAGCACPLGLTQLLEVRMEATQGGRLDGSSICPTPVNRATRASCAPTGAEAEGSGSASTAGEQGSHEGNPKPPLPPREPQDRGQRVIAEQLPRPHTKCTGAARRPGVAAQNEPPHTSLAQRRRALEGC